MPDINVELRRENIGDRPRESGPIWLFANVKLENDRIIELCVNFKDDDNLSLHENPQLFVDVFDAKDKYGPNDRLRYRDRDYHSYVISAEELVSALSTLIPRLEQDV